MIVSTTVIISVSSFFGGAIGTFGLMTLYNYMREQRELRNRTEQLYLEFSTKYE